MELPNLNYIKEIAGGDAGFEQQFITIVKTEFPIEKDIYIKNITNNELLKASEDVHKLKHKINILGLNQSYKVAANFEENLREGNTNLQDEFNAILKIIEDYIKTI